MSSFRVLTSEDGAGRRWEVDTAEVYDALPTQGGDVERWASEIADAVRDLFYELRHEPATDAEDAARIHGEWPGEFADEWPSVYIGEQVETFHTLSLWNMAALDDAVDAMGGFSDKESVTDVIALYCYAAGRMIADAVLAALAEAESEDDEDDSEPDPEDDPAHDALATSEVMDTARGLDGLRGTSEVGGEVGA